MAHSRVAAWWRVSALLLVAVSVGGCSILDDVVRPVIRALPRAADDVVRQTSESRKLHDAAIAARAAGRDAAPDAFAAADAARQRLLADPDTADLLTSACGVGFDLLQDQLPADAALRFVSVRDAAGQVTETVIVATEADLVVQALTDYESDAAQLGRMKYSVFLFDAVFC